MANAVLPIGLFFLCVLALAVGLLLIANLLNPDRPGRGKQMPYESGMDPVHDTHRRFDVRFHLLAIAFLIFDVEALFLYPWAVASHPAITSSTQTSGDTLVQAVNPPQGVDIAVAAGWVESRHWVFAGGMVFILLLILGYIYDWRKGVFQWR